MARLLADMSQTELGAKLGVTFQQVQKYEKGTNRISAGRMQKIADVLKQSVAWFFSEDKEKKRPEQSNVLTQMLIVPGGIDLARNYLAIKDNQDRRVVADVADRLAHAGAGG